MTVAPDVRQEHDLRLEPLPTLSRAVDAFLYRNDRAALEAGDDVCPGDDQDTFCALLSIYDLWLAPLADLAGAEVHQSDPELLALKRGLDAWFAHRLAQRVPGPEPSPVDAVSTLRRIAVQDLVPSVYRWVAEEATWPELVAFLAIEGGPDAGFDDLVAVAQVGLRGLPKLALATNYWDEMGRGDPAAVHTELHHDLVVSAGMPRIPRADLPDWVLERSAVNGLLATNRAFQPELIGALGLLEMQAGPRCRAVVKGLRRLGAPQGCLPFYEEHAVADPRHGKDWLARAVAPLAEDPDWARRMVVGARWKADVNRRFFDNARDLAAQLAGAGAAVPPG